ncbi:MAG: DUF11 domain-containing protein [Pyrinomonadaceae bacterium]|nr:DUF11 domain-containing protein [Pyrinomonadaceae bacterium]
MGIYLSKKLFVILFALAALLLSAQSGFAQLTITPTTWNVIGLDSNDVSSGPNRFPVGAEVCNSGGTTIDNVTANFNWNSSNFYLNLESGNSINVGSLTSGSCTGVYFIVVVTRNSGAYDTTRGYNISVSGDGAGTVSTPSPREIYVERLISQGRNSSLSIIGPSAVFVGGIYTFTLNVKTATQGYEQLESFLPFSSGLFQTLSINTVYSAPAGATNDKFYADACGWDNNPGSTDYRSCVGPDQYPGGKAGGTVTTTYTVKIVGTGTQTLSSLIYDFSGNSYHYNSDFGDQSLTVTAVQPPNLTISKSHSGNFIKGQVGTYTIDVSNTGGVATNGTVTVSDILPAGLTPISPTGTFNGWNCSISGQNLTCTRSDPLDVGASYPSISLVVNVALSAPSSVTNVAFAYGGGDTVHATLATAASASDPTSIQYLISCSKVYASAFSGGRNQLYELNAANMTSVFTAPQNVGGLAVSSNGRVYYDNATIANPPLFSFDGATQTGTGATLPGLLVGEAADALGNVYYIDNAYHLRRVNVGTPGIASDLGALVFDPGDSIGPSLQYGDMTFDGNGRLLMYSSIGGTDQTYLYVIDTNTLAAKNTGHIGPNRATGIAFDAAGNLITTRSGGASVVSINLASSNLVGTTIGTASPTVYDLGSCSTPVINPTLSAVKAVQNITRSQNPATIAAAGDVLKYTITVSNTGNMPSYDAAFADTIPASTTYVAGSTTLNGSTVPDVSGTMPFVTAREINSAAQPNGVIVAGGGTATIVFSVTVNSGSLPPQISNTGTVTYPTASGGVTTIQSVDSNTVNTPTFQPPDIGLVKDCTVPADCTTAPQLPDTELTYQIDFSNTGGASASNLVVIDVIPDNTDFKLGTAVVNAGSTGLTFVIEYSDDYDVGNPSIATWTYTPVSQGGGAATDFDRNVKAIRWRVTAGSLSQTSPNNSGSVSFISKIR